MGLEDSESDFNCMLVDSRLDGFMINASCFF
jgi:hypothetical protein